MYGGTVKRPFFARNVGLFGAEGEVILYIDDDAIANSNLLEETVRGFSDRPDIGVMGGEYYTQFTRGTA
ncbi:glycosyltransferase family A protein [Paenibacillus polymyxa]